MTKNPDYNELQEQVVACAPPRDIRRVLELGTGTGETARRVISKYPRASLIGIDSSPEMLAVARRDLPQVRVELLNRKLEDSLPQGPFDLVVSALTVHHLPSPEKVNLFREVFNSLEPGGTFILGDTFAALSMTRRARRIPFGALRWAASRLGVRQFVLERGNGRRRESSSVGQRGNPHVDHPDTLPEESAWLELAGFGVQCPWIKGHLAVLVSNKPG